MPIDTTSGPAWWSKTAFVVLFMGLFAGLEWGTGWWQNRSAAFSVGLFYLVVALAFYGRRPDRPMQSRGFYIRFAVVFLVSAALSLTRFFVGRRNGEGTFAFIMLTLGLRFLHQFRLA